MFQGHLSLLTLIYEASECQHRVVPLFQDPLWRKTRSSHNNGTCFRTDLSQNVNVSLCSKSCSADKLINNNYYKELRSKAIY